MVLDGAFVVGTIASFMMNGACCMYQISREEEFRESLRKDIQQEWLEQRQLAIQQQQTLHEENLKTLEERYRIILSKQDELSYIQTNDFSKTSRAVGTSTTSDDGQGPPSAIETSLSSSSGRLSVFLDEQEGEDDHIGDKENLFVAANSEASFEDINIPVISKGFGFQRTSSSLSIGKARILGQRGDFSLQSNILSSSAA